MSLKQIRYKKITVKAEAGTELQDCLDEAMELCFKHKCEILLEHNGRTYNVKFEWFREFLENMGIRITQ